MLKHLDYKVEYKGFVSIHLYPLPILNLKTRIRIRFKIRFRVKDMIRGAEVLQSGPLSWSVT